MSHLAFSQEWALAWAGELRASDAYRQAAAKWEGSLTLVMTAEDEEPDAGDACTFADLWHGECRAARRASDEDRQGADFVIAAGVGTWKRVLAGELEPIFGIMSGKLKLERGSLAKLVPQVAAARELAAAAARIDTVWSKPS